MTYWTTCSCDECVVDRRRKRKLFSMGAAYRPSVDLAEAVVRAKVGEEGWTGAALASACGLRPTHFQRHVTAVKRGTPIPHLGPGVARALLTMGAPTEGQVGARGSRRRLQALATVGHTLEDVAADSGVGFSTLAMIRSGNTERIRVATAERIALSYGRMQMRPGVNTLVKNEAIAKGWSAPLGWDDIDADARPRYGTRAADVDPIVVERILGGDWTLRATKEERWEVIERWSGSDNELERRTGWNVARDRREMRSTVEAERGAA